jgi:ribonuclease HII
VKAFDRNAIPHIPDFAFEIALWSSGLQIVAGIDEAGRGALAGPVAAAAIVLPSNLELCQSFIGVRDSKQLKPSKREYWAVLLREKAAGFGVGFASHDEIDLMGIASATRLAIYRAVNELPLHPQHLLIDFITLPELPIPQTSLVKGDARCLSIAAASILAKTARDEHMRELDLIYPGYGFAKHKGYGTTAHRQALVVLCPSLIHRRTFKFSGLEPITLPKNIDHQQTDDKRQE